MSNRQDPAAPIRVLVCDGSFTRRSVIARILRSDAAIKLAAVASNGDKAAEALRHGNIDIVVLDAKMPGLHGRAALPLLLEIDPDVRVILVSVSDPSETATVLPASLTLPAGTADYVPMAAASRSDSLARELLARVKAQARLREMAGLPQTGSIRAAEPRLGRLRDHRGDKAAAALPTSDRTAMFAETMVCSAPARFPLLLAIGSSTGGPQALFSFFRALAAPLPVPVIITQHMPPLFTRSLADHLERFGQRFCREASDNEALVADQILIAPGDRHLTIRLTDKGLRTRLSGGPPENSCRPSIDPMLRSAAEACSGRVLTVILTGMGQDGLQGARAVVDAGGCVLAQDEASSVVWGMPGAVARAGLCHAVLPVENLAARVTAMLNRPS